MGRIATKSADQSCRAVPVQPADLAPRSAHHEITERTEILAPADDDEAVAGPHDL